MNVAIPIRDETELKRFKDYYRNEKWHMRNQMMITIGLNTALRLSDILNLKWQDVYDSNGNKFLKHIIIVEKKTGKRSQILINDMLLAMFDEYKTYLFGKDGTPDNDRYLIEGRDGEHLSRSQAFRVIKKATDACGIVGVISPHSLRKTFGYHACKEGIAPVLLMDIFNHSSFDVTRRYIGIEQDDRDEVFNKIQI